MDARSALERLTNKILLLRVGIIAGLFDRMSEYRIRLVAWLFDERVGLYDD
jgi:hypothetical protein